MYDLNKEFKEKMPEMSDKNYIILHHDNTRRPVALEIRRKTAEIH